ncbi:NAD(P)H-dependent oxidoreductase [Tenacibaculum sp. IB213877]|uniref:NAD(P)H-dependent oxidoreductase n=1 Tax=Tenacibaculum sp. IB213877 TaxID=3097351 RepID=UPI002A5A3C4A|nr:NAD(P)H-dependent oxidoreductase [Tenacibaculum sp. IB213877]MDY0779832.1 NAD(P)H-dependent oxidoreductase [Tenacibaculum sp. IB213877]
MKHLVIVTHPNIEDSVINKSWINELKKHDDKVTIHQLYKEYPNFTINVQKEQELLLSHDNIIIQFPLHWFNTPFLLKKWMDEVLAYGWAFGPNGDKLKNKKIRLSVSTGGTQTTYDSFVSLSDLLKSVTVSFEFCGSEVLPMHVFFGANDNPTKEDIDANAKKYATLVTN